MEDIDYLFSHYPFVKVIWVILAGYCLIPINGDIGYFFDWIESFGSMTMFYKVMLHFSNDNVKSAHSVDLTVNLFDCNNLHLGFFG